MSPFILYVCMFVFPATFKVPESVKWLKFNYKNTGFYIVHYKEESWTALRNALSQNVSVLTQEDRASLIHNIFALSQSVYSALSYYVLFSCFICTWQGKRIIFQFVTLLWYQQIWTRFLPSPAKPLGLYGKWNWNLSCDRGLVTAQQNLQAAGQKTGSESCGTHAGTATQQ